jgi:Tfp pilus assembly protein PilF
MRKVLTIAAVVALALAGASCKKLESRDRLNKGVQAFKNAQYPEAVERFKEAVDLDPTFTPARLYLGTAYVSQYIPGADSPENKQMAEAAFAQFKIVLDSEPNNILAITNIAALYLNQKDMRSARQWYERLTQADPNNAVAFYSLGFVAWSEWYPADQQARVDSKMKQEEPGPIKDKKIREALKTKYASVVEGGKKNLERALQIDPEYVDAMAYMNLLYREAADLTDNKADYEAQIGIADDWVQKHLATTKLKAEKKEKQAAGGIHAETEAK